MTSEEDVIKERLRIATLDAKLSNIDYKVKINEARLKVVEDKQPKV